MSTGKQSAVLGHVLNPNSRMFTYIADIAQKNWWSEPLHGEIWGAILDFRQRMKRAPSEDELLNDSSLLRRENAEVNRIKGLIGNAINDRVKFGVDLLRSEIQTWIHAKILQNAYQKGHHQWNVGKYDTSADILKEAIHQLNDTTWADGFERKITDTAEIVEDLGPGKVVPFGIFSIDNHLSPGNKKGSLRKGDQTVLMAPVNVGKTTALITVAVHNIRAGNDVLFVTHEGHRSDLRLKMLRCYFSLVDLAELRKVSPSAGDDRGPLVIEELRRVAALPLIELLFYLTEDHGPDKKDFKSSTHRIFDKLLDHAQKHITFMPMHKPGMEVEEVIGHIERAQELWQATHKDAAGNPKGYDLFIDDYPGVLTTKQSGSGQFQYRHVQERVYSAFVQLALCHEWHSLVAIQTNRAGSKVNAGTDKYLGTRFLTNEDVAETWGAIMSAATVITVNRSASAQQAGRVTFVVAKSRSSTTGYAVTCYSNFGIGVSHADSLGGIGYYGSSEMQAVLDTHMKPGVNKDVPQSEVIGLMGAAAVETS